MLAVSLPAPGTQNSFLKEFTVQVKSGRETSYKCIVEASRVTGFSTGKGGGGGGVRNNKDRKCFTCMVV